MNHLTLSPLIIQPLFILCNHFNMITFFENTMAISSNDILFRILVIIVILIFYMPLNLYY